MLSDYLEEERKKHKKLAKEWFESLTEVKSIPKPPIKEKGKWVRIGECAVDSGSLILVDPCYALPTEERGEKGFDYFKDLYNDKYWSESNKAEFNFGLFKEVLFSGVGGTGVVFSSGFGDGSYTAYAYVVDFGEAGYRVAQVTIDLL